MDIALKQWFDLRLEGEQFAPKDFVYVGKGRPLLGKFFNPVSSGGRPLFAGRKDAKIELLAIESVYVRRNYSKDYVLGDSEFRRFLIGNSDTFHYFVSEHNWLTRMREISECLDFIRHEYQRAKELIGQRVMKTVNNRIGTVRSVRFVLDPKQQILSSDTQDLFKKQGYYIVLNVESEGHRHVGGFVYTSTFPIRFCSEGSTFAVLGEKELQSA